MDLEYRESLTRRLQSIRPKLMHVDPQDLLPWLGEVLQAPIVVTASGPTAMDRQWSNDIGL